MNLRLHQGVADRPPRPAIARHPRRRRSREPRRSCSGWPRSINADALAEGDSDPMYVAYLEEGNDIGGIDSGFLVKSSRVDVVSVEQVGKDTTYTPPGQAPGAPLPLLNDRPPLVLKAAVHGPAGPRLPGHGDRQSPAFAERDRRDRRRPHPREAARPGGVPRRVDPGAPGDRAGDLGRRLQRVPLQRRLRRRRRHRQGPADAGRPGGAGEPGPRRAGSDEPRRRPGCRANSIRSCSTATRRRWITSSSTAWRSSGSTRMAYARSNADFPESLRGDAHPSRAAVRSRRGHRIFRVSGGADRDARRRLAARRRGLHQLHRSRRHCPRRRRSAAGRRIGHRRREHAGRLHAHLQRDQRLSDDNDHPSGAGAGHDRARASRALRDAASVLAPPNHKLVDVLVSYPGERRERNAGVRLRPSEQRAARTAPATATPRVDWFVDRRCGTCELRAERSACGRARPDLHRRRTVQ